MHYVIGSGPAGVACTRALLQQGKTVTMLDAGLRLETERQSVVDEVSRLAPENWSAAARAMMREGMDADKSGVPLKRLFGSDFLYREADLHVPSDTRDSALKQSLARGGLSNVWGAVMLPYSDRDLRGWPLRSADLAPHYRAAIELTGLAGRTDELADWAPLYTDEAKPLQLSRQAARLRNHLEKNHAALLRAGWNYGYSRLAVTAAGADGSPGCVYCGQCMYGCPYGYIYNSAGTLTQLLRDPNFSYQPNVIVETVAESGGEVLTRGYHRLTGEVHEWRGERLFAAGGPISTSRLLLWSQRAFERRVWLRDSQYFLFPLLAPHADGDVAQEKLHTLSQLFLEIMNPRLDADTVHVQLYTYNDMLAGAVESALPFHNAMTRGLSRAMSRRLLIAQSYLHSDHSSRIAVELAAPKDGAKPRLRLDGEINPEARRRAKRVVWSFVRKARQLGALALPPMLQLTPVGRGYHTGGSFPMRLQPGEFETDLLGRPAGWQRVHAVDATVFPTIPATTITLSVMANAHRIGTAAARL